VTYEIDLNTDNADRLRKRLADFVGSARRTGGRAKRGTGVSFTVTSGSGRSKEETHAIRDWANRNGYDVAERGRVPGIVIEAFEAAKADDGAKSKPVRRSRKTS
jgi:hypothetical protein